MQTQRSCVLETRYIQWKMLSYQPSIKTCSSTFSSCTSKPLETSNMKFKRPRSYKNIFTRGNVKGYTNIERPWTPDTNVTSHSKEKGNNFRKIETTWSSRECFPQSGFYRECNLFLLFLQTAYRFPNSAIGTRDTNVSQSALKRQLRWWVKDPWIQEFVPQKYYLLIPSAIMHWSFNFQQEKYSLYYITSAYMQPPSKFCQTPNFRISWDRASLYKSCRV